MITPITLKDFILTGCFGPVNLGMPKTEVISLLGDGDEGFKGSLFYGSYEFFFQKEKNILDGIQNDHLFNYEEGGNDEALFQNDKFYIEPWFLSSRRHVTYRDCLTAINLEKIAFDEKYEWGSYRIVFQSGVYLSFDNFESFWPVENEVFANQPAAINKKEDHILEGIRLYRL